MNILTQIALAGTVKVANDPPSRGAPLDELFAALPNVDRERALLLRAAAEAAYELAGQVALPGVPLPEPASSEHEQVCSPAIARLVGNILQGQYAELLPEALRLLAEARLRLPETLLPAALSLQARDRRAALRPVLGERGRWLSRLNPAWSWAEEEQIEAGATLPSNAEQIWQEGTRLQRLAILRRVRADDPALARAWIDAVWREEKAQFRNDLIEILEHAHSLDDEPLLERALDDRAPTVRARAAALLARIPGSGLVQRMCDRADVLLQYVPPAPAGRLQGFLRSIVSASKPAGTLTVTLPQALDKPWERDGVVVKPPKALGERSWWLAQTLGLIPPAHWETRFGASPAELVAAASGSDSGSAVIHGWSLATALHGAADWALPLWHAWPDEGYYASVGMEMMSALMAVLPEHAAVQLAIEMLKRTDLAPHIRMRIIRAIPAPWNATFGNAFLDAAHRGQKEAGWATLLETFTVAAPALPPACFERALKLFTPAGEQPTAWYIKSFLATLEMRRRLYQEIRP